MHDGRQTKSRISTLIVKGRVLCLTQPAGEDTTHKRYRVHIMGILCCNKFSPTCALEYLWYVRSTHTIPHTYMWYWLQVHSKHVRLPRNVGCSLWMYLQCNNDGLRTPSVSDVAGLAMNPRCCDQCRINSKTVRQSGSQWLWLQRPVSGTTPAIDVVVIISS